MAAFRKFNCFAEDRDRGEHDFDADSFKICLTNVLPLSASEIFSEIIEIDATNGYVAGGTEVPITVDMTDGVSKVMGEQIVFSASGGSIGPFRYVVLYNIINGRLISFWDYGQEITIQNGKNFTIRFNQTSPGLIFSTK